MSVDPYVQGWQDCSESIAILCEIKARDLMASRRTLRDRILHPAIAQVYRHAAEIARATSRPEHKPEEGDR